MDDLRTLRDRAGEQYQLDTQPPQSMSAIESLHIWASLQNAYAWQLKQTATLFEQAHRENLVELQARIHKLIE
jgi:hypothetical protein